MSLFSTKEDMAMAVRARFLIAVSFFIALALENVAGLRFSQSTSESLALSEVYEYLVPRELFLNIKATHPELRSVAFSYLALRHSLRKPFL